MAHGTDENLKARKKIVEALFSLMKTKRLSEISVSDIVGASGVARSTYYRNYETKEQVIEDFLDQLHDEMGANEPGDKVQRMLSSETALTDQIERAFGCILKSKAYVLILQQQGLGMQVQDVLNRYVEDALGGMPASSVGRYVLYFITGSSFNVMMKWLEGGAMESPHEMAVECTRLLRGDVIAEMRGA